MQPNQEIQPENNRDDQENLEVVVGVFETKEDASRVAASLRGPDMKVQRVSRNDPTVSSEMPEIVYDEIEHVGTDDVANGAMLGGAIGAGSGLLLFAIPGLNIAAPIAGALAGAWIGGIAGIDEANRGIELPKQDDYRKMLADGKSFVVIAGDEPKRVEYGDKMLELGAAAIHQHPPVGNVVRHSESSAEDQR